MNITIFGIAFIVLSTITSLLTEAVKKCLDNLNIKYISEVIVLIIDFIVSIIGSVMFYIFNGIQFNLISILAIFCMIVAVFIGSELGYDKITDLIEKIKGGVK